MKKSHSDYIISPQESICSGVKFGEINKISPYSSASKNMNSIECDIEINEICFPKKKIDKIHFEYTKECTKNKLFHVAINYRYLAEQISPITVYRFRLDKIDDIENLMKVTKYVWIKHSREEKIKEILKI